MKDTTPQGSCIALQRFCVMLTTISSLSSTGSSFLLNDNMNVVSHPSSWIQKNIQPFATTNSRREATISRPEESTFFDGFFDNGKDEDDDSALIPDCVTTPVLYQVYPFLLRYIDTYGHPNIPLGTKQGRQCETLRRLHIQNRLTDEEINLLEEMEFRFHSLEDVYDHVDFDVLFQRLVDYKAANDGTTDVPKKYPNDPELGAWVTGIRRLGKQENMGKQNLKQEHVERLNSIDFQWVSSRKCGSKFMDKYRAIKAAVQVDGSDSVWKIPENQTWLQSQRGAYKRSKMSATRADYMSRLLGEQWFEEE